MKTERFLDLLDSDGALLADTARRDLDAPVPPCPGWSVRDVVTHTAEVYEHKLACISLRAAPEPWPPAWPDDRDPLVWFGDAHGRLLDVLRTTDPATPAYTWWPANQTVGFWVRRMAQETAMHRVDVQSAFAAVTPISNDLALDGVHEVLMLMLAGDWSEAPTELAGPVRVEIRTGDLSWLVTLRPTMIDIASARSGVADAVVGGAPSDVLQWLWGRVGDDAVAFTGDRGATRLLRERLALATG